MISKTRHNRPNTFATCAFCAVLTLVLIGFQSANGWAQMIGSPFDASEDFERLEQVYFVANRVTGFDPETGKGQIEWARHLRLPGLSFNKLDLGFNRTPSSDFPGTEYDQDPALPFSITFVSPRTIRLRMNTRGEQITDVASLMLDGSIGIDRTWSIQATDGSALYRSDYGTVRLANDPWRIEIRDAEGRLVTETRNLRETHSFAQPVPFSFIRRSRDLGRSIAASFKLAPDEKIFGCGESFTRLNKRGQKIIAYIRDAMGAQTSRMYKPIPFFMSSKGYGMFVHTSAPVTFDFGQTFDEANTIFTGDENLDLFIFLGEPKEILAEYTAITGRSPVPPLWSFGLWMSRITYNSEEQVRDVAAKLRRYRIPADVIHLDTGWFETDWRSDFEFSRTRFKDARKMIADLNEQGFKISLWQLPYFTSKNAIYDEIVSKGYVVRDDGGQRPFEDAIFDFSNPDGIRWYQGKIAELLKLGVGAIKVDFGEDAPFRGQYASGRTGFYEHNLYPLRYNKAISDITKQVTGDSIIWARSAWAGSQRYPLHWGGDAENTDSAMAATLRAGLSFGLSGFTFWSHDAGGFVQAPPLDLYHRWLAFGLLTSHTRCHGAPPREPWAFSEAFIEDFRRAVEMRYRLMPYLYAQATSSAQQGLPMLRTLFLEFPDDPTAWLIEDQYLLGSDLLIAPLFSESRARKVYLPPGSWIDYQTGAIFDGGTWYEIQSGDVPIIVLVRDHSVIPRIEIAQHTGAMDWNRIELAVFSTDQAPSSGFFALPEGPLQPLEVETNGEGWQLKTDPSSGRIEWTLSTHRSK